jgi:uncharacterized protein (DUF2236 family)
MSQPFGPGSVLYESYGDRLGFLCAGTTGLLQLMYPALGRGVEEHSAFYDEPLDRLLRSVPQIVSIIYDGDLHPEQARRVRDFHRDIKGEMPASHGGARYHALDPETFFWAHATFVDVAFRVDDLDGGRSMDHARRSAYYLETLEWWRAYGLTMRVAPPTYDAFVEYWDHHVEHVLELTPAAQGLVDFMNRPWSMRQDHLPRALWVAATRVGGIPARDVAVGALPPRARELCGFTWTPAQRAGFEAFRKVVTRTWPHLPERVRLLPAARAAYRRRGRTGLDAAWARLGLGEGPSVAARRDQVQVAVGPEA